MSAIATPLHPVNAPEWGYPAGEWPGARECGVPPYCPVQPHIVLNRFLFVFNAYGGLVGFHVVNWPAGEVRRLFGPYQSYLSQHWPRAGHRGSGDTYPDLHAFVDWAIVAARARQTAMGIPT
jgi:hypothetical protein